MHYFIIIALALLVIVIIVIAFLSYTSGGGGNNNNISYDDSDVPIAPSSLEYNRTYAPPKRNCDVTVGGSSKKVMKSHPLHGNYYDIPDEVDYVL